MYLLILDQTSLLLLKKNRSNFNQENFLLDYFSIDWKALLKLEQQNINFSSSKINSLFDTHGPLKKICQYKLKFTQKFFWIHGQLYGKLYFWIHGALFLAWNQLSLLVQIAYLLRFLNCSKIKFHLIFQTSIISLFLRVYFYQSWKLPKSLLYKKRTLRSTAIAIVQWLFYQILKTI